MIDCQQESFSTYRVQPVGESAIDKALAWHTGGQGSNPDMTKVYSAPILTGTPAITPAMPVVMCSSMNTWHGAGKKRGIMVKS